MKTPYSILAVSAALLMAGCGQKTSSAPADTAAAAPAAPREVDLTANDTMKYDVTAIAAKPGEEIKVVLTNTGTIPIEAMGHNWVLLKAGADPAAFAAAAIPAKATGYIPESLQDQIVAKIELLGPRKSGEVTFKAPTAPGEYTYLCTFPAHFQAGMHGILTVK